MKPIPSEPAGSVDDDSNVEEQAALWFVRYQSQQMTAANQQEFITWLEGSKSHQQAFNDIALLWRDMADLPAPVAVKEQKKVFFSWWRPLRHTLASLFILASLLLPYSQFPTLLMNNMTLATLSQPKEMTLADGSKIFLNRDSQVRVAYQQEKRLLWLENGEAYFKVKSNPYRPFIITVDGRQITVVGTEFSIRKQQTQVDIAVAQGVVEVKSAPQAQPIYLYAGDEISSQSIGKLSALHKIAIGDVAQWRHGQLSFENKPLTFVLEKLRPYHQLNIELSPEVGAYLVSGRVNLNNPKAFFDALPLLLPVETIEKDKNNLLIVKKNKNR